MPGPFGDAGGVDLNNASEEELERVAGIGSQRAKELVRARPLQSWEDLKRVPGFSEALVEELKEAGAILESKAA